MTEPSLIEPERLQSLVVELGVALHRHGADTKRVEEALERLADRFGLEGNFFAMPTGLLASFGPGGGKTYLVRLQGAIVDLETLTRLDSLLADILYGKTVPQSAEESLRAILSSAANDRGRGLRIAAQLVTCAAAGRLIGGGLREIALSGIIGVAGLVLAPRGAPSSRLQALQTPIAGFLAAFVATAAASLTSPLNPQLAMLAGLVVLLPGLALTTSITELAMGHLTSGTSRFAAAAMVFLTMGFGVALGSRVAGLVFAGGSALPPRPLPGWTLGLALLLAPVAISMLFRAPWRELPYIVAGSIAAYAGGTLGQRVLGAELGVLLGGFAAGAAANGYSRLRNRPSAIVHLPAIILLVPGVIGFQSVTALLASDVASGIDIAFTTLLMAASLVTGMLMAAVVVPARRLL